jgi:hypothetical protein
MFVRCCTSIPSDIIRTNSVDCQATTFFGDECAPGIPHNGSQRIIPIDKWHGISCNTTGQEDVFSFDGRCVDGRLDDVGEALCGIVFDKLDVNKNIQYQEINGQRRK